MSAEISGNPYYFPIPLQQIWFFEAKYLILKCYLG